MTRGNCQNCNKDSSLCVKNNTLTLCGTCANYKNGYLLTNDSVKANYMLTNKDLIEMNFIIKNEDGKYIKMYLKKDIENKIIDKYGSKEKFYKKLTARDNRRKQKYETIRDRRRELINYLRMLGLDGIREDSTVCELYIKKGVKSGFTKEEIGLIMLEMDFFYRKTNYKTILRTERKMYKKDMWSYCPREKYDDGDEEIVKEDAKTKALEEYIINNNYDTRIIMTNVPLHMKNDIMEICNRLYKQKNTGSSIIT